MTKRAIAAFAHPDDETFSVGGTLARAISLDWVVTAVCATRGEVGEIAAGTNATPETLGTVREQELRAACAALGVTDVRFLGYRDSGMDGTPENGDPRAYANARADEVIGKLVAIFGEDPPAVVFTFDESEIYGHPDHRAIHRHATQVAEWQAHLSEEQRMKMRSTEYFHVARGSKPADHDPLT